MELLQKSNQEEDSTGNPLKELLTSREYEVMLLLSRGSLNKEIAFTLGIALETVKKHTCNIFQKIKVRNRAEAVYYINNRLYNAEQEDSILSNSAGNPRQIQILR